MPALKATTGMPASMAFWTAGAIAGGSGRVTAMASTLASIALWIRVACLPESGSAEYWNLTLSLAAAASAPLRMMSQKVSPGAPWVIMATVISGVFALPALGPAAGVAPVDSHGASSSQRDVGNPSSTAESRGTGQRLVTTLPRV